MGGAGPRQHSTAETLFLQSQEGACSLCHSVRMRASDWLIPEKAALTPNSPLLGDASGKHIRSSASLLPSLVHLLQQLVRPVRIKLPQAQKEPPAPSSHPSSFRPSLFRSNWFGPCESTFYKHEKSPNPDVFRVSNDRREGCTGAGRWAQLVQPHPGCCVGGRLVLSDGRSFPVQQAGA